MSRHPIKNGRRAALPAQSPHQEPTEGALPREKGSHGAGSRPTSAPFKSFNSYYWKVASSEAFTLLEQFWPLFAERSNYAQIKLYLKVLLEQLNFKKQQT
ncbi:hypothetical protein EMIT0P265_220006 [Pseudomonas zeae]